MARLNPTDYAKHRKEKGLPGASRKSVYAALKKGWITRGRDKLIDVEKADAAWAARSRPRADGQSAGGKVAAEAFAAGLSYGSGGEEVTEDQYGLHRARREAAAAEKLELANAKTRGELVERAVVESAWASLGVTIRERLMALPGRLAPRLTYLDDEHQVGLELRREIEEVLNELADSAPGLK